MGVAGLSPDEMLAIYMFCLIDLDHLNLDFLDVDLEVLNV